MEGLIKKTQASRSATRLDFHMVGHVGEHEVVGGARVDAVVLGTDCFEFAQEVFIGHRARVLEFAQTLVGEEIEVAIRDDLFEGLLAGIGDRVLIEFRDTKEVVYIVVGNNAGEMVDLMIRRYRFAGPCEINGMCSEDGFVMTKDILELEIMLFAATVVLGVRAGNRSGIAVSDSAIGQDVTTFGTVS